MNTPAVTPTGADAAATEKPVHRVTMLTGLENGRSGGAVVVRCRDVAGRRRGMRVVSLVDLRVVVVAPPGEVAELTVGEAEAFRRVLHALAPRDVVESVPAMRVFEPFACAVRCLDALGRERAVTIIGRGARVVVAVPAGGVAVLGPGGVGPLCAALRAAIGAGRVEAVIA